MMGGVPAESRSVRKGAYHCCPKWSRANGTPRQSVMSLQHSTTSPSNPTGTLVCRRNRLRAIARSRVERGGALIVYEI